ncbi:AcrR family transcriptional regulator [Massilia sp. MP_M2]|uniref:TetR/AcrR family transcriptional regulator n=1 Tax=Massilia sp. MP_M2 TaxID=3071713 RepID=UPI00319D9115
MTQEFSNTRSYRGQTPEQRRAERRSRLIAGAISVYGERGYHSATVKAVCDTAGLTERYFYESFANSEILLIDCYNFVTDSVLKKILLAGETARGGKAARSRAMLYAYFSILQSEPRSARVFLLEIRGVSVAVDRTFDDSLRQIGKSVARLLAPEALDDELLQAGVIGGVIHIAMRWIACGYEPPIDRAVSTALRLGTVLANPRRVAPRSAD